MSISIAAKLAVAVSAAVLLPLMLSTPAFAAKNNHGYTNSLEDIVRKFHDYCDGAYGDYRGYEYEAQQRAGTKEAKPFSDAADAAWAKGEEAGCSWAQ